MDAAKGHNADLILCCQAYTKAMEQHQVEISRLATKRRRTLHEARRTMTATDLARALGISRQQLHRLLKEGRSDAA